MSMRNGVIQRGRTWSFVVRERDPESGLSKPRWVSGFPTEQAAVAGREAALADRAMCSIRTCDRLQAAGADKVMPLCPWHQTYAGSRLGSIERGEVVYYVRLERDHTIKIGYTTNLAITRKRHRRNYGPVTLLGSHPGGLLVERAVHALFPEERIGVTELFRPSARLLAHIDEVTS